QIASDNDDVGLFGIDHLYPLVQLLYGDGVSQMQIADTDYPYRFFNFSALDGQVRAFVVVVLPIAVNQRQYDYSQATGGSGSIVVQHCRNSLRVDNRGEMIDDPEEVDQNEEQAEIEQCDHP